MWLKEAKDCQVSRASEHRWLEASYSKSSFVLVLLGRLRVKRSWPQAVVALYQDFVRAMIPGTGSLCLFYLRTNKNKFWVTYLSCVLCWFTVAIFPLCKFVRGCALLVCLCTWLAIDLTSGIRKIQQFLSQVLELYKFKETMYELQNGKSLGPDDLSLEFYKEFVNVVGSTYLQMCQKL